MSTTSGLWRGGGALLPLLMIGALSLTASPVSAQSASAQSLTARRSDTAFSVSRTAVIEISVTSNDIRVIGSDRPTAELRAPARSYKLQSSGVSVSLSVDDEETRDRRRSRSDDDLVQLSVPRGVRLVIHGASGDVRIADVTGDVEVHVQSGDVQTRNLGGRAIIETLSGDINIEDGVGDLRVTTVSGDLTARGVRGSADVNTTSGTIVLGTVQATRVEVEATSGDLTLSGSLHRDAQVKLITHSGDVAVRMSENVAGLMDITTFNGDIEAGGMTMLPAGTNSKNTKRFEVGGGGNARISISTFNGDVVVQRQRRSDEEQ